MIQVFYTYFFSKSNLFLWLFISIGCMFSTQIYAQGPTCATAEPFCTDSGSTFPAGVNSGTAPSGNDYDCLFTQPNPAWYYLEIDMGGTLNINMSTSPAEDIDFIVWGPFPDIASAQGSCGALNNIVDCSYSAVTNETANIPGAVSGQVYLFLITNYSNDPTNITVQLAGGSTGTTNCDVLGCPPVFSLGTDIVQCEGDGPITIGVPNDPIYTYQWSGGSTATTSMITIPDVVTPLTNYILTISENGCTESDEINVTINPIVTSDFTINDTYCQGGATSPLPPISDNGINGTWSPAIINNNASETYTFTPNAGQCGTDFTLNVTITPNVDPTFSINDTYCQGEPTDILPPTSTNGINGTWSPAVINNSMSGAYTFTPSAGQCANNFILVVTITVETVPTFTITDTYCEGSVTDILPTISNNGINGTWSPFSIDNTGSNTYTFTPSAGQCASVFMLNVTIATEINPTFYINDIYCQGGATDILPTTSNNGINGSWSPSIINNNTSDAYTFTPNAGQCANTFTLNVTITPTIDPTFMITDTYCEGDATDILPTMSNNGINGNWSPTTIDNSASGTYTFTPVAGQCANPFMLTVTITQGIDPTFTITDTYCEGDATDILPTMSNNGINGGWSPMTINNSVSGTYTFTPTAGQCANPFMLTVTITTSIDPTFTITDTYCEGDAADILPTMSNNGINGAWSPTTIDNSTSGTYTFTPVAGQCASDFIFNVTITPGIDPTFTITDAYCQGEATDILPTTSTNGINGSWSPSVINNNTSGIYTFTPNAGQCASNYMLSVDITPATDPTFTITDTYCEGDATDILPTMSNNGINGAWSPTTINNSASGTYTFTPTAGQCANPFMLSVTITTGIDPTFTITDTYCEGDATDILPTMSNNGINGNWSPTTIDNSASGTYSFTPTAGQCANPFTLNVTITTGIDPIFSITDTYCEGDATDILPTMSNNGINGAWSPTTIDNSASGTYSFTPTAGQCANPFMLSVTITTGIDPTFTITDTYCEGDAADILPTMSNNGINGAWSPTTINNSASGTYTFTPTSGQCANPFMLSVTITTGIDPTFAITDTYCEGDAADILPTMSNNGINGAWSPTTINNSASGTYTFTPTAGQCANPFMLNVTITTPTTPIFNLTSTYCVGDLGDGLPTFSDNGINGTWSPSTILTANAGNNNYTFTPNTGCFNSFTLSVTVNDCGCMNPTWVAGASDAVICEGETAFLIAIIDGSASSVTWTTSGDGSFNNPNSMVPIYTPGSGDISNGSIFLTVTTDDPDGNGPCLASSDEVIIIIEPEINPIFSVNNTYCQGEQTDPLPTTSDNGISGTWSPTTINNNASGNYTFTPSTGQCANSFILNVMINPSTDPIFSIIDTYCEGEPTETLPTTSDNGISGTWSPASINNVSGSYTFTPNVGQCGNSFILNVMINPSTDPTFSINDSYCEGDATDLLPTTSDNGISGTWSPSSIDNNADGIYMFTPNAGQCASPFSLDVFITPTSEPTFSFNAFYCVGDAGEDLPTISDNGISGTWLPTTISTANAGNTNYTFTPSDDCAIPYSISVTVNDCGCMNPATIMAVADFSICAGEIADLSAVIGGSATSVTWSTAGDGSFDNINDTAPVYTPGNGDIGNGSVTITVTTDDPDGTGPCLSKSDQMIITIDAATDPIFTLANNYCQGEMVDILPTISNNGITGTWSPNTIDNTSDGVYTFTPNAGECANDYTINVTIDAAIAPIFTLTDNYCQGETTNILPTVSNNGITGTWSPNTIDNASDGVYTFTPNVGECANNFTLNVTIDAATDPAFTLTDNYCQGETTNILPAVSNNGITGTWSPNTIDNTSDGVYTFTPNAGECANDFTLNVTIEAPTAPTFTITESYCAGDMADVLPTTSENGVTGTWSPTTINTTNSGNTSYTFTPTSGCFSPFTLSVTVNDCGCMTPAMVTALANFAICTGETADLSATLGGSATTLTWTTSGDGSFDDIAATNPIYTPGTNDVANGSVTVIVTTNDPDGSDPCLAASDDVVITISAPINPTFTLTDNYCQGETTDVLPTVSNNGISGTWSPSSIDNMANGSYVFTPNSGQCANDFTLNVTINAPTDPTFTLMNTYCMDDVAETLPTTSNNGVMGTWSPSAINTMMSGTTIYTFTPTMGCFNPFTISITVNNCGCANPPTVMANNDLDICDGATANLSATLGGSATALTWTTAGDGSFDNTTDANSVYTPGANDVANGSVTVTVTSDDPDGTGPCTAVSDNVVITIDAPIDPTFTLTENYCQGAMTNILPTVSDNGIMGTWSPNTINNTANGVYTFSPSAGQCANSFFIDVTIDTPIDPTFTLTVNYCQGAMTDVLPTVSDNGIMGTWSPTSIDNTANGVYTFTPNQGTCANSFILDVTINQPTTPTFSIGNTYCVNDVADVLPTTSDDGISGTWNPAIIGTANAGNASYTFTPTMGCFTPFILNVTIEDCGCMNPATVNAINNFTICSGETANLSATLGGSATSLTWTTAGDGTFDDEISDSPVYTPGANDITNGSVIVTVTTNDPDGPDPCLANSDDVVITISVPTNPTFTLTNNYCAGEMTNTLPTTSNNGISGTWSPDVIDNMADETYVFMPNMGQCANPFTLNVTIELPTDPTFTITPNYCPGETTDVLLTTSNNGISGTWQPDVIDNMADGTYVFTPNMGQCANTFTLNVTISNSIDPVFDIANNYCQEEMTDILPTTSLNGIMGTWSPNIIDNQANGVYTFTPGGCANSFTLNVTIETPTDPVFVIENNYCLNDIAENLPATSENGIEGTWTPSMINTAIVGNTDYAFTPTDACSNSFILNVVIDDCGCMNPATIAAIADFTICVGETANLSAQLGGSATMLTWSTTGDGTFDNTTATNPVYTPSTNDIANGAITITAMTDDPDGNGPCSASSDNVIITINAPVIPIFTLTETYCAGETTDALPTTSENGIAGTWSPNSISNSTSGVYTFTPNTGECANGFALDVIINNAPIVSNIMENCDSDGESYTVIFTISGGDSNTYMVTGGDGTLVGNTFTSNPIADETSYNFVVEDINGCSPTTVSGQFDCPNCPDITFDLDVTGDISCNGEANGTAMVSNLSSDFPPIIFTWSNGDNGVEAENLTSGWQFVTVTDGEGCFGVDSIFLNEPEMITAQMVANDSDCFGDNNGSILFDAIAGGTAPFTYSIDGENFSNQNQFNFLSPGAYEIAVQDANGCMFTQDMMIAETAQILVDLGMDTIINLGDSILLDPIFTPFIIVDTFIWLGVNCINCPEVTVTPLEAMTISLTIETLNGCGGSDAIFLGVNTDVEVYLPNVFSPNGDGINDVFYPQSGPGVEKINEFLIFNRWGEQVFQYYNIPTNDPLYGWDGSQRGKLLNPQVCVWYAEVLLKNGRTIIVKGDVTIVN